MNPLTTVNKVKLGIKTSSNRSYLLSSLCSFQIGGFGSLTPDNYYESSFQTISKTHAIDHLRYRFYWESYVRNSTAFMNEIEQVANAADKYGIKIVYDNHQFHTSSWLNVERGTGFPIYLFNDSLLYEHDSGGAPKSDAAQTWWTNWWNNAIRVNGTDGWTLQLNFLKNIVTAVDKHPGCVAWIKSVAEKFELTQIAPQKADTFKFLEQDKNQYNIIFADPPYDLPNIPTIPQLVMKNNLLTDNGVLIVEHPPFLKLNLLPGFTEVRKYGNSSFSFFEKVEG